MQNEKAYEKAYDLYMNYMKQHIEGFNFFLVISGLLINALIGVFNTGVSPVGLILLCFFEAIISVVFFLLDMRTTKYMKVAKGVVKKIEAAMCEAGEFTICAVLENDLERKKTNAKFRMTYVFWIIYATFFLSSVGFIIFFALAK